MLQLIISTHLLDSLLHKHEVTGIIVKNLEFGTKTTMISHSSIHLLRSLFFKRERTEHTYYKSWSSFIAYILSYFKGNEIFWTEMRKKKKHSVRFFTLFIKMKKKSRRVVFFLCRPMFQCCRMLMVNNTKGHEFTSTDWIHRQTSDVRWSRPHASCQSSIAYIYSMCVTVLSVICTVT